MRMTNPKKNMAQNNFSTSSSNTIVVIGAGPAGSVCASVLAKYGTYKIILIEKSKHPRHHVGESLQPAIMDILAKHLGSDVCQKIAKQSYAYKFGAQYIWGESRKPWRILFDERLEQNIQNMTEQELWDGDFEHAWQVSRSSFDAILFEATKNFGVQTYQNTAVTNIEREHESITKIHLSNGEILEPDFVVDATGQTCLLGRNMGWYQTVEDLKSVAVYGYFEGAGGVEGILGRHVQLVVTVPEGWIWFIPISETMTSIGLVTKSKNLTTKYTEDDFLHILKNAPIPLENGQLVSVEGQSRILYARDWSYQCKRFVGENFLLVGDAACFVDPILSGGVDFAIRSAANAALAILQKLDVNQHQALFDYQEQLKREYHAYLRMARYWYESNRSVDGFFWQAYDSIDSQLPNKKLTSTPLRAFVYLTSGRYAADQHFRIFTQWQEKLMFSALGVNKHTKEQIRSKLSQQEK